VGGRDKFRTTGGHIVHVGNGDSRHGPGEDPGSERLGEVVVTVVHELGGTLRRRPQIVPRVGCASAPRRLSRVLLPAPLPPSSAHAEYRACVHEEARPERLMSAMAAWTDVVRAEVSHPASQQVTSLARHLV
jgi:hypothetical protein